MHDPRVERLAKVLVQYSTAIRPGDLVAAGWNFGMGSSRETAPRLLLQQIGLCLLARAAAGATPQEIEKGRG